MFEIFLKDTDMVDKHYLKIFLALSIKRVIKVYISPCLTNDFLDENIRLLNFYVLQVLCRIEKNFKSEKLYKSPIDTGYKILIRKKYTTDKDSF